MLTLRQTGAALVLELNLSVEASLVDDDDQSDIDRYETNKH